MLRLIIVLLVVLVNAASPAQTPPAAAQSPTAPVATTTVPGPLNGYVSDVTYKLRVGDTVSFQILEDRIWNSQDAPKPLVVTDSGEVDVPYIGRVMAVGKTSKELADAITTALEKDYYNKATVILSLNLANRVLGQVYVSGQVRSQGALEIQMNENLTAGRAILRSGGFGDFADKTKVKVVRGSGGTGEKPQNFDLDMFKILEQGKTESDIVLQPGDLIFVPTRLVNF